MRAAVGPTLAHLALLGAGFGVLTVIGVLRTQRYANSSRRQGLLTSWAPRS